jgi:hypothetical protein
MRFKLASLTGGFRRSNTGGDSSAGAQGSANDGAVSASTPITPLKSSKNPTGKKEKGQNVLVAVRFRPLR